MPHDHHKKIAKFYYADTNTIKKAIETATEAQKQWDRVPISERYSLRILFWSVAKSPFYFRLRIWEKAASLMAGKYRARLNATTMLGQSKTIIQAEIDSAAELIDFFRYGRKTFRTIFFFNVIRILKVQRLFPERSDQVSTHFGESQSHEKFHEVPRRRRVHSCRLSLQFHRHRRKLILHSSSDGK